MGYKHILQGQAISRSQQRWLTALSGLLLLHPAISGYYYFCNVNIFIRFNGSYFQASRKKPRPLQLGIGSALRHWAVMTKPRRRSRIPSGRISVYKIWYLKENFNFSILIFPQFQASEWSNSTRITMAGDFFILW